MKIKTLSLNKVLLYGLKGDFLNRIVRRTGTAGLYVLLPFFLPTLNAPFDEATICWVDAYEYLMRHFATDFGKSKGQFYTPAEASHIMAKVIGIGPKTRQDQTIYDPTCGPGSLLLKAALEALRGISIYGQEMDNATWSLARMNMILHDNPGHEIWRDNTLAAPHFKNKDTSLKTFDFAVANPPFSTKSWTSGLNPEEDEFDRYEMGISPAKNGDYAFLLHLTKSLRSKGKGAIILPHGVLFRGNKEADIRGNLIQRELDEAVLAKYPELTEAEIKKLEERYARPLPELESDVKAFSAKVQKHLKKMGLSL